MQSSTQNQLTTAPVQTRVATLDVLRGLALVGILTVNMEYYSQTSYDGWIQAEFHGWADMSVRWLVSALFQLKAYLVFGLLFGYGIGMQLQRQVSTPGVDAKHLRRMLMLALLGVAHALLLFSGDILFTYALCGMVSLAMWRLSPMPLIAWSVFAFFIGILNGGLLVALFMLFPEAMSGNVDIATVRDIYTYGTVLEMANQRLLDVADAFPLIYFIQGPMSLAMLLAGIAMAKLEILTAPHQHERLLHRMYRWGLPIGLVGSAAAATLTLANSAVSLAAGFAFILQLLAAPACSFAIVAWIALRSHEPLPRWLRVLAPAGRMSLTVYIGQSLVCALIFTSYGLGLFARFGPVVCMAIALAVSVCFVVFSHLWFKRYRFGPLEWLLRSATYWRRQPFRRESKDQIGIFPNNRKLR